MTMQTAGLQLHSSRPTGEAGRIAARRQQRRIAPCCAVRPAGDAASQRAQSSVHGLVTAQTRRALLASMVAAPLLTQSTRALAFTRPPPGYLLWTDELDGYEFLYPSEWLSVKSAGAEIFFRNPRNVEENLFVEVSSPSSTKFADIDQYGSLSDAGQKLMDQYLIEFTSTRIGVRREAAVVSTSYREASDGRKYLDSEINVKSFAVEQQYGISEADRGPVIMEWDRRLVTTLGVANGRLYSLRLQVPEADAGSARTRLDAIQRSFRAYDV